MLIEKICTVFYNKQFYVQQARVVALGKERRGLNKKDRAGLLNMTLRLWLVQSTNPATLTNQRHV